MTRTPHDGQILRPGVFVIASLADKNSRAIGIVTAKRSKLKSFGKSRLWFIYR